MRIKFLSILVLQLLLLFSCKNEPKEISKTFEEKEGIHEYSEQFETHKKRWSYEGETSPEYWTQLEGNGICGGKNQSPINIIHADASIGKSGLLESDIHYPNITTIDHIINNGHSIQYNFKGNDNYVNFKNKRYNLVQFHFHAPSEHTINGIRFPLVMHMVHVNEDKEFVVFGVLFQEGKRDESFGFLESYLPIKPGETKEINKPYDFSKDLPSSLEHFYYKGSLTTPPCTETVNWFVFTEIATISTEQMKALSTLMPKNNFRNTQPLNGRRIVLSN